MKLIEQMLTGKIPMSEFSRLLQEEKEVQDFVRQFVPQEAVNNPSHLFWDNIAYTVLEAYDFDYLKFVFALCRFNGKLGDNLNIFRLFEVAYKYYEPNINATTMYREAFHAYLDAVGEYYEGAEVTALLNQIVVDALPTKPKSRRTKAIREKLKEAFHVCQSKRPYWIQGGDWPMGENSPMQYIGRVRIADGIRYIFRDVDTGEERIVEQFY